MAHGPLGRRPFISHATHGGNGEALLNGIQVSSHWYDPSTDCSIKKKKLQPRPLLYDMRTGNRPQEATPAPEPKPKPKPEPEPELEPEPKPASTPSVSEEDSRGRGMRWSLGRSMKRLRKRMPSFGRPTGTRDSHSPSNKVWYIVFALSWELLRHSNGCVNRQLSFILGVH
ncbi:hypothetical protein T310_0685 [Rasamsonia emersonii CBS 393.64]|uniref:Uncharacterized protein n=1 Tax=Rasamsonia emersonii (strain ATCC 16479 / CBS 393.64 / IMI 116815) TaxID=1408163 RepID=A0A0F4Z440_RASE3|nr:hypothetical protein T310_0685 [Rasamsonia emersonii CBS 393.64]KKA25277.1 hypothetical protein T310_0685 [Rasamsonia emersonii CBS 393.64]